jgi:phosphate transport system permease protein
MSGAMPAATSTPAAPRLADRLRTRSRWRTWVDRTMRGLSVAATVLILIPLAALIAYVAIEGWPWIDLEFLTSPPVDYIHGGALAAILGTLQIVPLATLVAAPVGVLGGIFLAEIASDRVATIIRFGADVLVGLPSIVVGVFVYTVLVVPFHSYSALAGIAALAIIMFPVILRNTEEMLRLVPASVREGALALGMPRWRVIARVVVRAGFNGLLTGVILAFARAAGETAPLLLTALGSRLVNVGALTRPMDALPMFVYVDSGQPSPVLIGQAWGAALLLLVFVLAANVLVRIAASRRSTRRSR